MIETAPVALRAEDLPALQSLLRENQLPWQDCPQQLAHFVGLFAANRLIAAGALEAAAGSALLRSIVVDREFRSKGIARQVVDHLLQRARAAGYRDVYLFTETATDYFAGIGFVCMARDGLPESIRDTEQFKSLCPQDASCMRLKL